MKQLVEEREAGGLFASFQDFCERMYDRELNRRALECLIKAGSFDSMGYRRSQLLKICEPGRGRDRTEPPEEHRGTDRPVRHGE